MSQDQHPNGHPGAEEAAAEDPAQIRAEIEETRAEMSQTIDAIQEKLDPQHIKEQVAEKVHEATIGRVQELAHTASEKISETAQKIGEALPKTGDSTGAATAPTTPTRRADTLKFLRQNPLIVGGAAAVAAAVCLFALNRRD